MNLTTSIVQAATGCTSALAALYAPHLADACSAYGISTPTRLAAFMAQVGHESESLQFVREIWGPTPAQARYEGRVDLGNVQAGDGRKFCGRGLIQVTGRFNYQRVRDRLRSKLGDQQVPDFEVVPDQLERPNWAAWSAAQFWTANGCNELADRGEFEALTKRINGALNGLADRKARWEVAKLALDAPDQATSADQPVPAPRPSPAPIEAPEADTPADTPKGPNLMDAVSTIIDSPLTKFALAAVNPLLAAVPEFIHLFTDKATGQTVPERNVAAVTKIVSVAQQALADAGHDVPNAQAVAELVSSDPAAKAVAREALMSAYYSIAVGEAGGGGIAGARAANAALMAPGQPGFWLNPAFIISVLLLLMPFGLLADVFFVHPGSYVGELRTQIVTGLLAIVFSVAGYWIGTSFSSAKKDERPTTAQ